MNLTALASMSLGPDTFSNVQFFFPPFTMILVCLLAMEMLLATDIPEAEHLKENVFEFSNWQGYSPLCDE